MNLADSIHTSTVVDHFGIQYLLFDDSLGRWFTRLDALVLPFA